MNHIKWKINCSAIFLLIFVTLCAASDQRSARFRALDRLRTRYMESPLASFLSPLWNSKPRGEARDNSTQASPPQEAEDAAMPLDVEETGDKYPYYCPPCWCGIANRMDRIVGGWSTEVNEYPWMAALLDKDRFFCGGTLISDRHVLTAAHCVRSSKRHKNLTVLLSEHNRATPLEAPTEVRRVARVMSYPKYNAQGRFSHDHDIALLKLDTPLQFKPTVAPVCLPQIGEKYTQATGTVLGWGRVSESGDIAPELQAAHVPVMSDHECRQFPGFEPKLTDNMMCAGYVDGGRDSCQGDSGGALLAEDAVGRYVIAGIVSWGVGCARPQSPGVYTRVNHYMEWIRANTRDGCFCF